MVVLNAHFDGKVLVPDEPLDLKPNQRVRITVEPTDALDEQHSTGQDARPSPVDLSKIRGAGLIRPTNAKPPSGAPTTSNWHALIGIGLEGPTNPNPRFPDDDAIWEGSLGDTLVDDPRRKPR